MYWNSIKKVYKNVSEIYEENSCKQIIDERNAKSPESGQLQGAQ
jgi:hypothetical protein